MTDQLLAALREAYEGPNEKVTYFLDPDGGLRKTLASLSADEASKPSGGNSVAAHAHHLLFSFEAFGAFISGDRSSRDWNESWRVSMVDDAQWSRLQEDLGSAYEKLRASIQANANDGAESAGGSVGAVAHFAYHIGAIRQKIAALRK